MMDALDPDLEAVVNHSAVDRSRLLKSIPVPITDLICELGKTKTSEQDQLVLTSLDVELAVAGLEWSDLANLLKHQIVAQRVASLKGRINAIKSHPNKHRLQERELKFLNDIHRRNSLLTDKQESWLQSIADSLDESDDDFALRALARSEYEGRQ